jgi:hypothetical protein
MAGCLTSRDFITKPTAGVSDKVGTFPETAGFIRNGTGAVCNKVGTLPQTAEGPARL